MKILIASALLVAAQGAGACFLTGEQISGMNKICFYNCVSGTKAITISAVSLCPLSLSQAAPQKQQFLAENKKLGGPICAAAPTRCSPGS